MQSWKLPFLGRRQFLGELTDFEIDRFFTFTEVERLNIMSRDNDRHRVAVAVHLGFIRMTGCHLDAFESIPQGVLRHIGEQLRVAVPDLATLRALYRRRRTLPEHQNWAANVLGFNKFTEHRRRSLVAHLRREARHTPTLDKLVANARQWLYGRRILLPGPRTLLEVARRSHIDAEQKLLEGVRREVGPECLANWEQGLFTARGGGSILQWLQEPPSAGTAGLRQLIERIDYLKSLDVHRFELRAVRLERQRYLARQMRRRRPARFRALREPRRVLEMSCFLRVCLLQTTDTALALADQLIQELHSTVARQVKETQAKAASEYLEVLRTMSEVLRDKSVADDDARTQAVALLPYDHELFPSRAAAIRWKLTQRTASVRRLMRLLMHLTFEAAPGSPLLQAVSVMRECYNRRLRRLPDGVDSSFAPRWADIIDGLDRDWALRGFEAALLFAMRKALKNGTVWVSTSLTFRRRNKILVSEAHWETHRQGFLDQTSLTATASPYVDRLVANLGAALESVNEAVAEGEVSIDERGVHLSAIKAEDRPDEVERTAREIFRTAGAVQLPDLMVAIDNETRFSWCLLGREPTSDKEVLGVYAGLLAHGTELDAAGVSLMIPELTEESIRGSMRLLEEDANLREANERVLAFQHRHPVVQHWGEGVIASSDSMTLDASRHLWNARVDPKRRRHGIGIYTHVLDTWGIVYDQPIVVTQREAGAAIEGAIRQGSAANLERIAVDTRGYTDFAMAVARLLGFDLCPRLKSLRDRRLHVPRGFPIPDALKSVVDRDVSLNVIEAGWDELLRVVASVDGGWTSAVLALDRFGSASHADPVYKAGRALGQLLRTLYLCDFFTNPRFRREVLRILDHGESAHTLQRVVYFGGIKQAQGRRREQLIAISGSLTLLCNVVMAWMTRHIQSVLDEWRTLGRKAVSTDVLRHISPARSSGLNLRGTMSFPLAQYRERLIPAATRR